MAKLTINLAVLAIGWLSVMDSVGCGQVNDYFDHMLDSERYNEKAAHSTVDLIAKANFEYEQYNATSLDGYITRLVRLVNPFVEKRHQKPLPVVLYAGQGVSPAIFLLGARQGDGPIAWPLEDSMISSTTNRSLAFTLSNNGYDVWLVPARGIDQFNEARTNNIGVKGVGEEVEVLLKNLASDVSLNRKISNAKKSFSTENQTAFWQFNNDDIIRSEFGQQLDLVIKLTRRKKLALISYSNGGFISFAYMSNERKFVEKHIDSVFALAPTVFVNPFNWVFAMASLYGYLTPREWPFPVEPVNRFVKSTVFQLCKTKRIRLTLCRLLLNQIYGVNAPGQTLIELELLQHIAKPMSSGSLRQISQVSISGQLRQYDHLILGNLAYYKQLVAPAYNLTSIRLNNLHIFSGDRDALAHQNGIYSLTSQLLNCQLNRELVPGYNHLDFVAGIDVADTINGHLLYLLDERSMEIGENTA